MSDNKTFHYALLVSLLVHSVFFFTLPHMPFVPSKRSLESLQVTYCRIKEVPEKKLVSIKKGEPVAKKLPEIKMEEVLKPPKPIAVAKRIQKREAEIKQAPLNKPEEEKKFEAVVEEEKDDARKATYISYYRTVREKIRQLADRNYPRNRRLSEGEIFLSFVVVSSGELLQVKIIDERSAKDAILRDIAINSIRDAGPFPPFPEGMSQYQITFNVIISFER